MKTKLAMVDLDGTLFDTKTVNYCAYRDALCGMGVTLNKEYFDNHCNGNSYKFFLPKLLDNDMNKVSQVHKTKKENYKKYVSEAKLNKPLLDLLKTLKNDYYIALVTTASKENCMNLLGHGELLNFFDLIVTGDSVSRPKPHPEPYNYAMDFFNVKKENCIVFEDSETGIESAKQAGLQYFIVKGYN